MPKVTGQVVLVTGASSGIGRATARSFADAGAVVYAGARRPESQRELASEGFRPVALDVTDAASMVTAVEEIESRHGRVDVLINNAGYALNGPVEELTMDDVRRQFETNVFGLIRMAQLVLPAMRDRGHGRIINLGSVGGTLTAPGAGAYHASKYAVEAISDALRMEVAAFGIQVTLIQPTAVRTPFAAKINGTMRDTGPDSPYAEFKDVLARTTERMFSGRGYGVIRPEAVASTILRAASADRPRTRYLVGASARLYTMLHQVLPDRAWDGIMARQFPVRPPGEQVVRNADGRRASTSSSPT